MIASCTKCSCCSKTEKSNCQFESQTAKTGNCGKQETVGNRKLWETSKRRLKPTWRRSSSPPSRRPALGRVGEELPPSLARLAPPPIKGGARLLLETHKFPPLISGLEPFGLELLIALACGLEPSNWCV